MTKANSKEKQNTFGETVYDLSIIALVLGAAAVIGSEFGAAEI